MPFSRQRSLAVKIPLLTSLLLLAALAAMSVASYLELRSALVEMSRGRLQQAADQMANVFALSARQRMAAMKQLMQSPDVREYLRSGDASKTPAIDAAIRAHLGPAIEFANVELWNADGKRVFAVGTTFDEIPASSLDDYKKELQTQDDAAIGKLRQFAGDLRYPLGGRLTHDGQTIGYVVERRSISNPLQTRQTVALLTGLIGNEATMVLGNADGTTWSNLSSPITGVPIVATEHHLWDYKRPGAPPMFAWATPIASTPWAVAIEFPQASVLGPSRRFLTQSLLIAGLVLLAAIVIGWLSTRGITTSLRHVTEGAEAVADSRPHVHVDINREDEIGRLADSFNRMAARVEQARLDLELRVEMRTAELSAANRELEAFSYSVSHDLRAPLRAIAGFVQILEEDHSDALDATAKRHLDRVKLNARRMGQLIDDLLSFSRIGRSTMVRQAVDLTAMAKVAGEEAIAASGRPIALTIATLPPVYGESALLNQVFVNLISNAVKFTAHTAQPAITVGTTTINDETVYFVRDNGAGFDERYAEKLFGVFQRLHRADEFEGTGVGLAIVQRVISRHGGRVWAEGKPNEGATFYFTLPTPVKAVESKPA